MAHPEGHTSIALYEEEMHTIGIQQGKARLPTVTSKGPAEVKLTLGTSFLFFELS